MPFASRALPSTRGLPVRVAGTLRFLLSALAPALALVLAGCATAPSGSAPGKTPPPSEASRGPFVVSGLTVAAPQGGDWVISRQSPSAVLFLRGGPTGAGERWAAWVQALRPPRPIEGYFDLATLVDRMTPRRVDGRYRDTADSLDAVAAAGARCIARLSRIEEYDPAPHSGRPTHAIVARDYYCRHPRDARTVVHVHVAERNRPDASFAGVTGVAERFFAGVGL